MRYKREKPVKVGALDRAIMAVAPRWGLDRLRARMATDIAIRHYEAAAPGRRTEGWSRRHTDANMANWGSLATLRALARDLVRNNGWARRGKRVIANHTVGWGLQPALQQASDVVAEMWKEWSTTTQCDADGLLTFAGLQRLVVETTVESGEALVRRRPRRLSDGLAIPLQLQVLEPDFIDTSKDNLPGQQGGVIVQGVEFDAIGRRAAYWLFEEHPGSGHLVNPTSRRVPASEILHHFRIERPGQVRGPSWFAPTIVKLKDYDEYADATLMKQKIAACFSAFVTDPEAPGGALAEGGEDAVTGQPTDTLEPGLIVTLPPGKQVMFGNPPTATDHESFSASELRAVAAAIGVTYEDLTGDYSRVNFASGRLARLAHWDDVNDWQQNMLIPLFCDPALAWAMEATQLVPGIEVAPRLPTATWTPPPVPMVDPEREGLALTRMVRGGGMTHEQMVRERGYDPAAFWAEYKRGLDTLDRLGIVLDSDARRVNAQGLVQATDPLTLEKAAPKNGAPKNGAPARGT